MKLLKYINTTNPNALINGCVILTDAEIQTLIARRAEIKALITDKKRFITRVGEGLYPSLPLKSLKPWYQLPQLQMQKQQGCRS